VGRIVKQPKRPQGRPAIKPGEPTVTMCLRLTQAQRDKVARLGGAEWVRGRIERAKEKTDGMETD